ncbi:hypothetical protein WJX72_002008 [[Myrmecia] bisecta]|uniref:Histone deacetylase domain-containing protein n=1 Tax=[Myrmecia] bisecta TaxID=41462 RepID=A0AAW1R4T0_9CHLO
MSPAEQDKLGAARVVYIVSGAPEHDRKGHPETAARVPAILDELKAAGVTAERQGGKLLQLSNWRAATLKELETVHCGKFIRSLRETIETKAPTVVADFDNPDENTYVTRASFDAALKASGAALALVDAVVEASKSSQGSSEVSRVPTGYAVARPPGHHALHAEPMGFCLFNNVAIAARYAQQRHGLKKVMILDFDVHHGNGTQDLFYDDPSVLMIDVHEDRVWPGTGQLAETGSGAGRGYMINVPLPVGSGDAAMKLALDQIIKPAAERFKPDMILISAGYDAHWRDPLEHQNFQSATYHHVLSGMRKLADKLCGGRLVVLLEGGYSLQGLSEGVAESFLALLGEKPIHPHEAGRGTEPSMEVVTDAIAEVKALHGL